MEIGMDRHGLALALDVVAAMGSRIEAERRLPREVVDALVAAGVFKRMVPRAYGGADASVREAIEAIEAIARVDGSAGWCAMIGRVLLELESDTSTL